MSGSRSARWLMSFADLTLLLLAFFVLLHARADGRAAAASVRAAFGGKAEQGGAALDLDANALFESREAVLRPAAVKLLRRFGARAAATHSRVRVAALGSATATTRLDAWEISAARAAAVARAIGAGGVDGRAIDIALPQATERSGPQHFSVRAV